MLDLKTFKQCTNQVRDDAHCWIWRPSSRAHTRYSSRRPPTARLPSPKQFLIKNKTSHVLMLDKMLFCFVRACRQPWIYVERQRKPDVFEWWVSGWVCTYLCMPPCLCVPCRNTATSFCLLQEVTLFAPISLLFYCCKCLGLARTIYIRYIYSISGREITKYTVTYGVHIRCIYIGLARTIYIRCIYTVLASPINVLCVAGTW
jgi:hypothetical protein